MLIFMELMSTGAKAYPYGLVVENCWLSLHDFIGNISLEDFVIIHNHFHYIITFLDKPYFISTRESVDLSHVIGMFKSKTTNLIRRGKPLASQDSLTSKYFHNSNILNKYHQSSGYKFNNRNFSWQKSYYDHIIRNESDLLRIKAIYFKQS